MITSLTHRLSYSLCVRFSSLSSLTTWSPKCCTVKLTIFCVLSPTLRLKFCSLSLYLILLLQIISHLSSICQIFSCPSLSFTPSFCLCKSFPIGYHIILITIGVLVYYQCPLWMCWKRISWRGELRELKEPREFDRKGSERERENIENIITQHRTVLTLCEKDSLLPIRQKKSDIESICYSKWKCAQLREVNPVHLLPMHLFKPSPLLYISFTARKHYQHTHADTQVVSLPHQHTNTPTHILCFSLCHTHKHILSLSVVLDTQSHAYKLCVSISASFPLYHTHTYTHTLAHIHFSSEWWLKLLMFDVWKVCQVCPLIVWNYAATKLTMSIIKCH